MRSQPSLGKQGSLATVMLRTDSKGVVRGRPEVVEAKRRLVFMLDEL